MADNNWNATDYYQTKYWSVQLPTSEDVTRIVVAHERIGDKQFPFLLIFNELINADHWWGGRERFGHGHQVKFELLYFDPRGQGDFIAGEELRWLTHYVASTLQSKKETFCLDDQLREHLNELPSRQLFCSILDSGQCHSLRSDAEIIEKTGVPFEVIFEQYQDQSILAEEREAALVKRRDAHKRWGGIFRSKEQNKEKPYEPKFDLNNPYDKLHYLLAILKRASGFDIYAAPKRVGENSFEGAGLGMFGIAPFPGPIDFLEGMDKEDGEGRPGNTGLNIRHKTETHNSPYTIGGLLKRFKEDSKEPGGE